MEATAIYPYEAGSSSELSFMSGDKIIIFPIDNDWCRGKLNGVEGYVPKSYITEKPHSWFKGNIGRVQSEELLLKQDPMGNFIQPDGAFLIRNSENSPGDFSISVKYNGTVQHFKIFTKDDKFFIWTRPFDSFNALVEYHYHNSISRSTTMLLRDMIDDTSADLYQGLYDFNAVEENELSFRKGDILKVFDRSDNNWWKAEKQNGDVGLIPAQYVSPYTRY